MSFEMELPTRKLSKDLKHSNWFTSYDKLIFEVVAMQSCWLTLGGDKPDYQVEIPLLDHTNCANKQ